MRVLTEEELTELMIPMIRAGMQKEDILQLIGWIDSDLHMKDMMEIYQQHNFRMTEEEILEAMSIVITKYKNMNYDEIPQE